MSEFVKKDSVIVVFTGEGKGKTSAGLGLMIRALGAGQKVAFIQFIKSWEVSEHKFIKSIAPIYGDQLTFYKGGFGFFEAGELSSSASKADHIAEAEKTYSFALDVIKSGDYDTVICDEINNAVHDGLLDVSRLVQLVDVKHLNTNLCLTGRHFPKSLASKVDIITNMTKVKHHYDDGFVANVGVDY